MKYTHENITELLTNYGELTEQVKRYVNREYDPKFYNQTPARINFETHTIEQEVNTACNCHPEYEWQEVSGFQEFLEWYEKQQVTENT